jgi:hypothetical protein
MNRFGIQKAYCLENRNYSIQGNFITPQFKYVHISFAKCVNSTANKNICKSDAEINSVIGDANMNIYTLNTYVDFKNYTHPVKFFIDSRVYWTPLPDMQKKVNLMLRKNEGKFQDDVFAIVQEETTSQFFQVAP